MKIDRARAQKAFADYAAHYNAADAKVKLKIDHTYRVAALCARIAQSLALPPEDVDLAWLSGILHDVGRFEQLRRYNTFIDAQSVSHAALSVAVLFDEGRIRDYLDDAGADALLRTAVEWHSAFRLPEALDDRTRLFCQILRDADKIDILRQRRDTDGGNLQRQHRGAAPEPGDARRAGRLLRPPLRAAQLKAVPRRQRRRPCVACV